ncbi:MAG: hypothetical protein F9K49_06835 [Caedimonadaceae bacterium]|nr:MAG: hypothetical protein F9K49_06835 [Caedimonadaceae bacterium]
MKKLMLLALLLCAPIAVLQADTEAQPMTIKESTAFCEKNVPEYCISTTCNLYCDTLRTEASKANCKSECTADKRCKLKPLAGNDDPKNAALDADNREKLIACIAEKRDPAGTKSGRRMTQWEHIMTPSLAKIIPQDKQPMAK